MRRYINISALNCSPCTGGWIYRRQNTEGKEQGEGGRCIPTRQEFGIQAAMRHPSAICLWGAPVILLRSRIHHFSLLMSLDEHNEMSHKISSCAIKCHMEKFTNFQRFWHTWSDLKLISTREDLEMSYYTGHWPYCVHSISSTFLYCILVSWMSIIWRGHVVFRHSPSIKYSGAT